MIDRKVLASYILAGAIALAGGTVGVSDAVSSSGMGERVRALEVRADAVDARLERMEKKIDVLIERGK